MERNYGFPQANNAAGKASLAPEVKVLKEVLKHLEATAGKVKGQAKAWNPSLTGTGTLILDLEDVNDNGPEPSPRNFKMCNQQPPPTLLVITDRDTAKHGAPFAAQLIKQSSQNWTITFNETGNVLSVASIKKLDPGLHQIYLRLTDSGGIQQDTIVEVEVCECHGDDIHCQGKNVKAVGLPIILMILGSILVLLILLLLLLLFIKRRKKTELKDPLLTDDDRQANIFYYDEEGGGEEDQDYDLSQLHRGLDAKPEIMRNDIVPTYMPAPQYRPLPADPNDIGNFINDNLKAADDDPTAPPYDSLLVFDFEGGESNAGSLSSLNSSSSGGEQDYDYMNEWGPKFKKLSDMYGGEEDG
ncbi:B-cadherin-like [Protopterus annectens]|uniref:B-cadherin-like n=1 Tax=Protopterus annectens TaxID=7888 RepID=UPI001CFA77C2|nr:B-cadherin-like [Protopterus annectens]